jgi:DNA-binding Xre family transcriptional regulator
MLTSRILHDIVSYKQSHKEATMFTWRVRDVARERGITSATQLAEIAGIAIGTATALWYGRQTRVDLPILGRVCKALGCMPSEILVYTQNERRTGDLVVA